MHKKTHVWRAGEAGEQARAKGVGKGSAYFAKSRLSGAHHHGASGPRRRDRPSEWLWRRLVGGMTLRFAGWPTWPGMVVMQVGTAPPGMAVLHGVTSRRRAGRKG